MGRGLVAHSPLFEIKEAKRTILLPPELRTELRGEMKPGSEFPGTAAAELVARFMLGLVLKVSQKNRRGWKLKKPDQPDFERLEGYDEIWVLCFRKPGAGWRLSGRFLERDVLVLFDIRDKRDVDNDYKNVVTSVTSEWQKYFGDQAPHSGNWIDAYISGSHFDVDEKKQIG